MCARRCARSAQGMSVMETNERFLTAYIWSCARTGVVGFAVTAVCLWLVRWGPLRGEKRPRLRALVTCLGAGSGTVFGYRLVEILILLMIPSLRGVGRWFYWSGPEEPRFLSFPWFVLRIRAAVALDADYLLESAGAGMFAALVPGVSRLRPRAALTVLFGVATLAQFSLNVVLGTHPIAEAAWYYMLFALALWVGAASSFGLLVLARKIAAKLAPRSGAEPGSRTGITTSPRGPTTRRGGSRG